MLEKKHGKSMDNMRTFVPSSVGGVITELDTIRLNMEHSSYVELLLVIMNEWGEMSSWMKKVPRLWRNSCKLRNLLTRFFS